jgi:gas vesicle protein
MNLPPLPEGATLNPVGGDNLPPLPQGATAKPKDTSFMNRVIENLPKEIFDKPRPTAQLAIGALKPFAGLAEYGGITAPAEVLNQLSQRFEKGSSPVTSQVLDVAGQVLPMGMAAKAVSQVPQMGQYLPKAVDAIKKVVQSSPVLNYGLQGAGQAALTPVSTPENADQSYMQMLEKKMENIGTGLGIGAALGKGSQMLMNPQVSQKMQMLKDMGMKYFTPGQLMSDVNVLGVPVGKSIQRAEQALTSLPLSGAVVSSGLETSFKDFNQALGNKVLAPLGEKLPKTAKSGNEMITHIRETLDKSYDDVVQRAQFGDYFDPNTQTGTIERLWNGMSQVTNQLVPKQREAIQNDITDNIIKNIEDYPILTGAQFRNMEKELGRQANKAYEEGKEALGEAYSAVQSMLRTELSLQNPAIARQLTKTHEAFRLFQPVEKAAAMRGSREGVFTPQQFKSSAETSAGRAGVASGRGMMIPESQASMDVLGGTLPNSGTADRALTSLTAGKVLEGAANVGTLGIPLLGASAIYNPLSLRAMSKVATDRPEFLKNLQPEVSGPLSRIGASMKTQPSVSVYDPATGQPITQEQPYATPQ